jgi:hypothetical protein
MEITNAGNNFIGNNFAGNSIFVQILNGGEYRGPQDPTTGSICMGGEVPLYYRTLQKSQEIQGILLLWTYFK